MEARNKIGDQARFSIVRQPLCSSLHKGWTRVFATGTLTAFVQRCSGLTGYCTGLMLPLSRKSVEPIAARIDPLHASAKHQSLHHFVAKAQWSDQELLRRVAQWVVPLMDFSAGGWWIIDDTGFPKKGKHSVGVTRQYCGVLGKQDNCQVAVRVTLACEEGSLPVTWQLYLPHVWTEDNALRAKAGIPENIEFATKPQIALQQIQGLLSEGAPRHCVLADAGYGIDYAFRQGLTDQGLVYVVGITSAVVVWPPGVQPLPPKPYSGMGRPPVMPRRTAKCQPLNVRTLALGLPNSAFHNISWREGTNEQLTGRFVALAAMLARPVCFPSNGCLLSGPPIRPSLRNITYPHCQRQQQ